LPAIRAQRVIGSNSKECSLHANKRIKREHVISAYAIPYSVKYGELQSPAHRAFFRVDKLSIEPANTPSIMNTNCTKNKLIALIVFAAHCWSYRKDSTAAIQLDIFPLKNYLRFQNCRLNKFPEKSTLKSTDFFTFSLQH
jgi:hypothetical protein